MRVVESRSMPSKTSFQAMKIHRPEKWSSQLLDAVVSSPGIQKAATKYQNLYLASNSAGVMASADMAMHKVYYISLEPKNIKKTVQKIITFDSDKFDEWYLNNAIKISSPTKKNERKPFLTRVLDFFR